MRLSGAGKSVAAPDSEAVSVLAASRPPTSRKQPACFIMHRELLSNPHIGAYPALLLLALFGGYLLARWRAVRNGVKGSHLDNLILLVAVMSLFGARFFSWWFYFP